jgi:hypothetical protein
MIERRPARSDNHRVSAAAKILDRALGKAPEHGDVRAAELARKIYRSHRKAIDFILENRDDPISEATAVMKEFLTTHAGELGIIMDVQNKGFVRFIPKDWNVPQNSGGTAWGPNSRIVLCEISFWTKNAELQVTVGDAPMIASRQSSARERPTRSWPS